jgi:DNA repair protein RecN (Recombination protein N)
VLLSLTLKDFVLVKSLSIEFLSGLSVLTGETGAGKSILVDALSLVLGNRSDISLIREGAEKTEVHAEFSIPEQLYQHATVFPWLDFSPEDSLILKRVVDRSGKSKAFINGAPVTLSQIKQLSEYLVDIHGQHAHYLLSKPSTQLTLLDQWGGHDDLSLAVKQTYLAWSKADRHLEALKTRQVELISRRTEIERQLDLISRLSLKQGDWEKWEIEHKRAANAHQLITTVAQIVSHLDETDLSLLKQIAGIGHQLENATQLDPELQESLLLAKEAFIQLQECLYSLNRWMSRTDVDPATLASIEEKIQATMDVSRQLRTPPSLLCELADKLAQEQKELGDLDQLDHLTKELNELKQNYLSKADLLTLTRKKVASLLAKEVTAKMQSLHMQGGSFDIQLSPLQTPTAQGLESVEFLFSGHSGVAPKPLSKVASGGELARVSLALAVVSANSNWLDTLIFDEVDTGIGGATAEIVGQLLRELGQNRQVLCVTHLAQVAAAAQQHLLIQKTQQNGETYSTAEWLAPSSRVSELARMMGGVDITETTKRHAQEWLDRYRSS